MVGYLEEAKKLLAMIREGASPEETTAPVLAQCALACALVAQTELLTAQTELLATQVGLLATLIQRLDALTEFDGGKALFVKLTK